MELKMPPLVLVANDNSPLLINYPVNLDAYTSEEQVEEK